jgi:hypothetical protein
MEQSMLAAWLKFLFQLGFSAVASFLFSCGGFLLAGKPAGISIGFGMTWAACSMVYLFRRERSKLTSGMMVALPESEAEKELASNFQIIEKTEEKK